MIQPLPPDVEREYMRLIEEAHAHFSAKVRWSETHRLEIDLDAEAQGWTPRVRTFEEQWLLELDRLRKREAVERATYRVMTA